MVDEQKSEDVMNETIATYREISNAIENNDTTKLKDLLSHMHHADIADFLHDASLDEKKKIVEIIKPDFNPELLTELDSTVRQTIIEMIGVEKSADAIDKLESDDALYVLEDLKEGSKEAILANVSEDTRQSLEEGLSYPENSAGRIMHQEFITIPEYFTVGDTIDFFRESQDLPQSFYEIYIVSDDNTPVGSILVSKILTNQRSTTISSIMNTKLRLINADTDQEELSYLFKQYALTSLPIVDQYKRIAGVIYIDDMVEVLDDEMEEDLMRMGGVSESDIHMDFISRIRHRFPWLFANLLTASLSSLIISQFQDTISHIITIAAIMPIVASMSGNCGMQTATIAVRGIATKEMTKLNSTKILLKEVMTNGTNGLIMALFGGGLVFMLYHNLYLSLIFSSSIIICFTLAGFLGSFIPMMLYRLKLDPAVSSSIFLTALTDMSGFFTFLMLVTVFLKYLSH